jgi:hypothetical protein
MVEGFNGGGLAFEAGKFVRGGDVSPSCRRYCRFNLVLPMRKMNVQILEPAPIGVFTEK